MSQFKSISVLSYIFLSVLLVFQICFVPEEAIGGVPTLIIVRRVKDAEKNLKEGNYDVALDKFRTAETNCETSSCSDSLKKEIKTGILSAHNIKLNDLYKKGDYAGTIKACEIAIYEAKGNTYYQTIFLKKLAESHSTLNHKNELKETCKKIHDLNPSFNEKDWELCTAYVDHPVPPDIPAGSGNEKSPTKRVEYQQKLSHKEINNAVSHMKELVEKREAFQKEENPKYVSVNNYSKAINTLAEIEKKLNQQHSKWAKVVETLGDARKGEKKYNLAISKYNLVFETQKGNISIANKLAALYLQLAVPKPQKTIAILTNFLNSSSTESYKPDLYGTSLYLMGNALRNKRDYDQAISYYKDSLKVTPENSKAYMALGEIYESQTNRCHDALIEYESAVFLSDCKKEKIDNSSKLAKVYKHLGLLKASMEQWEQIRSEAISDKVRKEADAQTNIIQRELEL